jgi:hypothetical protein
MLTENEIFPRSYKLHTQDNFINSSKALLIHNLNEFSFKTMKKIKHISLIDSTVKFENIVNFLSLCEDSYDLELLELNIDLVDNTKQYKVFFELLDFYYGYSNFNLNIITGDRNTPFEMMFNIFNQYEINTFHNFGLSICSDDLDKSIWYNENVFKSIDMYVRNSFSINDEKYYLK